MNKRRPGWRSLRFRLVAAAVIIEIIMLSMLVWNSMHLTETYMVEQTQYRLNEVIPLLQASLAGPLLEDDIATMTEILQKVVNNQGLSYIAIKNSLGHTMVAVGNFRGDPHPGDTTIQEHMAKMELDHSVPLEREFPVVLGNRQIGSMLIEIDTAFLSNAVQKMREDGITIASLEVFLSILLLSLAGFALTRKLYILTGAAEKISRGDLSARVEINSDDEIGALQEGFNKMLEVISRRESERDLAEATLRESERHFRDLVETSNTIPWELDLNTMCFTYVGPQAERILGYPLAEWYGEDFWKSHIHPDDRDWAMEFYTLETEKLHNHDFEYRFIAKDGKVVWIRDIVNVIVEQGAPVELSGFMLDITSRKEAELELQRHRDHLEELVQERTESMQAAMQETERASKLKSEFLGRMSHELRTPLNAILGFGQLLEDETLTGTQREFVNEMMHASRHLLGLIDEVLDLSRIESGKLGLVFERIRLKTLVGECISLILPLARQTNIGIENFITDEDLHVTADRVRLKEALLNILSNAVKYNKQNGSVMLNGEMSDDHHFRLQVRDTGPGIRAEDQDRLYEPFNRLGAEYSDIEGTGIGLTISRQLMELMGGAIGFESEEGQGSIFWLDCPVGRETDRVHTESKGQQVEDIESDVKTVLYVEDNPANLRLIEKIVERNPDIRMLSAPNAEMGIELARQKHPDLILMDLNLPGMDGYEALSCLRKYPETRDITVIALSAAAMPRDIERGILAGFKRYLTKPVQLDELREVLTLELGEQPHTG